MPPSPVTRISPGRDLRSENHKRRHSLEIATISRREKDDELALFNEVHIKERDNFLLQSNDDFDVDIFSTKLRYFSDHKVEISVPARGESSELLNADGDKNDYDWLITPPETPLFRSLDDQAPPQVNHAHRGRPRSQPDPISRSPTTDKGQRNGRGSASPHRFCPSPRNITSPSRVFSPSPSKPTPRPRSNTPPLRRITSSAQPKIISRPSNNGFSSEPPPNLRTSLSDRYARGSSPASRNGSRKSRSPVASRSIGSSHSRGSVASSGDDDLDSLRSVPVSSSAQSGPRGVDVYPGNSPASVSRKPSRSLLISTPRRSLDLVRQMDRKGPQNMFRPLLSSVPSSTFHAGNASSQHHSLASKCSSSITTSCDASSDLVTSGPHDTKEVGEQNQDETTSDSVKGHYDTHTDDELFATDQNRKFNEVVDKIDMKSDYSYAINSPPDMVTCSECRKMFHSDEVVIEGDPQFCCECKILEVNLNLTNPVVIPALNSEKGSRHWSSEPRQNIQIIPTEEKGIDFSKSANDVKGHSFENTSFTTSNTSFSLNSTKSSISMSVSSSVDLGFSRQTESRIYRQSSGQKSDTENYSYEFEEKTCLDPCEQSLTSEFTVMESACTNIENNVVLKNQEVVKIFPAGLETSIREENAGLASSCADGVEAAEVPCTGSLDAMLETEIGNGDVVISANSGSDVDTTDSKSCVNELRDDECIAGIVDGFELPEHRVIDKSRTVLDDTGDAKSRSLTLEEATDAILFCSSIVHNLAYEAANIAINNETSPTEVIRPTVTHVGNPDSERRDNSQSKTMRKRNLNPQKARPQRLEMDAKPPSCNSKIDKNPKSLRNVGSPNNVNNKEPLKIESNCNCVIM